MTSLPAKVIATVDELEKIAADDDADVLALKGWRRDVFGQQALKLKHGKLAISYRDRKIVMVDLDRAADLAQAAE